MTPQEAYDALTENRCPIDGSAVTPQVEYDEHEHFWQECSDPKRHVWPNVWERGAAGPEPDFDRLEEKLYEYTEEPLPHAEH